jgi:hypothetical protein
MISDTGAKAGRMVSYRARVVLQKAQRQFLDQIGSESLQQLRAVLASAEGAVTNISTAKQQIPKSVYKAVADGLHQRLEIRREDVLISLVEVNKENWSFGNGEAQYAIPP